MKFTGWWGQGEGDDGFRGSSCSKRYCVKTQIVLIPKRKPIFVLTIKNISLLNNAVSYKKLSPAGLVLEFEVWRLVSFIGEHI